MVFKTFAAFVFVVLISVFSFGQTIDKKSKNVNLPNLSGSWKLVKIDGKKTEDALPSLKDVVVKIAADGDKIEFEQSRNLGTQSAENFTFFTDGRGEANLSMPFFRKPSAKAAYSTLIANPPKYESKTFWKKDKLVTNYIYSSQYRTGSVFANARDEWRLSEDGKKLILTKSSRSEASNIPSESGNAFESGYQNWRIKLVFERID